MKLIAVIMLLCSFQIGAATFGSISLVKDGKRAVSIIEIPDPAGNVLENHFVSFLNPPENLNKNSRNCFCYSEDDIRFAYVQAYYHASKQLQFFKDQLSLLGISLNLKVSFKLNKTLNQQTWGMVSDINIIELEFSQPAFDYTLFAHEIAHVVHQYLGGSFSVSTENENWFYEQGFNEGTANILAALYLENPVISAHSPLKNSVDLFVREPDQIFTNRRQYEEALANEDLWLIFPQWAKTIESFVQELQSSENAWELDLPSPYFHSNIVNQPLWHASKFFGRDIVLSIYLKTISQLKTINSYSDLAQAIVDRSNGHVEFQQFLMKEFKDRGLIINH